MIDTTKNKEISLGRRLVQRFKSQKSEMQENPEPVSDLETFSTEEGGEKTEISVVIEPTSELLSSQSLLKRTELDHVSFMIGRRGSIAENYYGRKPDYLIAELEPFSISRHHCSIKKTKTGAVIKDLGSKTGFVVGGVRYGGRRGKEQKVELGVGVHTLILGLRDGKYEFKITIE